MSLWVAGVIGAVVTLAVIMILGGLRLVSKNRLADRGGAAPSEAKAQMQVD